MQTNKTLESGHCQKYTADTPISDGTHTTHGSANMAIGHSAPKLGFNDPKVASAPEDLNCPETLGDGTLEDLKADTARDALCDDSNSCIAGVESHSKPGFLNLGVATPLGVA